MSLTIDIDEVRAACAASVRSFLQAAEEFTEHDLLGASRCHGWSRLDVVTHVLTGWQEMLQGLVAATDELPTVDAASYWRAFEADYGDEDPVLVLMSQRRRTSTYSRPSAARRHLVEVGNSLLRGIDNLADRPLRWQGHVFSAGDFLTVWAVEDAVHQLDLRTAARVPDSALDLARRTVEALMGCGLPDEWTTEQGVLIATGRMPVPDDHLELEDRLPALR